MSKPHTFFANNFERDLCPPQVLGISFVSLDPFWRQQWQIHHLLINVLQYGTTSRFPFRCSSFSGPLIQSNLLFYSLGLYILVSKDMAVQRHAFRQIAVFKLYIVCRECGFPVMECHPLHGVSLLPGIWFRLNVTLYWARTWTIWTA